jgi:hypothetical protein
MVHAFWACMCASSSRTPALPKSWSELLSRDACGGLKQKANATHINSGETERKTDRSILRNKHMIFVRMSNRKVCISARSIFITLSIIGYNEQDIPSRSAWRWGCYIKPTKFPNGISKTIAIRSGQGPIWVYCWKSVGIADHQVHLPAHTVFFVSWRPSRLIWRVRSKVSWFTVLGRERLQLCSIK